eukprot:12833476-Alexandrium_andersonii.AAC.1
MEALQARKARVSMCVGREWRSHLVRFGAMQADAWYTPAELRANWARHIRLGPVWRLRLEMRAML